MSQERQKIAVEIMSRRAEKGKSPLTFEQLEHKIDKWLKLKDRPGVKERFGHLKEKAAVRHKVARDHFEAMRVLGIYPDPSARLGEHHAACDRLECNTCGRVAA